ncbi:MAG TPA: threonine/serine dehydratase [Ktedonobacterales bacterium]|nr:threonine/serine dehydratase [Ktedonobacterales bacterium]
MSAPIPTLPTLADVEAARPRIAGRVHRTPLSTAHTIGALLDPPLDLYLKEEQRQKTGSFKVRGVLNRLATLDAAQRARGLVTVSAGNHAQAVSWAAAAEGLTATVFMRRAAVASKVAATRAYGATVDLSSEDNTQAFERAHELEREHRLTFVHPFDDPMVVAGQGTLGAEILDDLPAPDLVIAPVGGGGLISGVALAIKERAPTVRVIGVEPVGAQAVTRALAAGHPVNPGAMDTIADGLAAPFTGALNLALIQRYVDEVVLVSDDDLRQAMRLLLERCKLLAEPAGAAGLAALLAGKVPTRAGQRVVVVVSGGNVDVAQLATLLG